MTRTGPFSPQITVEDIIKLALPPETRLVAGETGLSREVLWAIAQRPRLPAFPHLKGGEIVLVSMESHPLLHDEVPFSQLIRQLADRGVAAVGIVGETPAGAEGLANSLSIPLLALPPGTNLRELENQISRTITERRTELYKWEMELHRRFTRISVEQEGVPAIVRALAEVVGQAALFEDESFKVQCASPDLSDLGQGATVDLGSGLIEWPKTMEVGLPEAPIRKHLLPGTSLARLVTPIVVRKKVVGYLSLLGPADSLNELARHALSVAASACALELARTMAVVEVENRFRGEFIDSLIDGTFESVEEISNRGRALGYDPSRPHLVAIARLGVDNKPRHVPARRLANTAAGQAEFAALFQSELSKLSGEFLIRAREDDVVVLCPLPLERADPVAEVETLLERARHQALLKMPEAEASVGLGRAHPGPRGVSVSYKEAKQALAIAQFMMGGRCTAYFGNLVTYRLLFLLKDTPELSEFYQETLGKLVEHDRKNGTELLQTLETFFTCDGNAERAAQMLFLHRNTLAYRLRRIQQLTGLSLRNIEDSFRLQLALKVRKVLQAASAEA